MLHGDQDPIVPAYNYENFAVKCQQLGVDNFELFVHEGGKHMFFFKEQATTHPIVDRFLAKHLKP
jgi:alpha-beta hydrolase superfamily lysophospholipase